MNWHMSRLREELQKEIGIAIANNMRDPRVPDVVTVVEVKLAPDGRDATVLVSMLGNDDEKKEAIAVLNKGAPFLQHILGTRIVAKFLPRLHFKLDKTIEQSEHINELFKKINDDLV
jgi:ribosome-binding factor A